MSQIDINQLLDTLRTTRLLDDARLAELRTRSEVVWGNLEGLAKYLVEQTLVTPFQMQELLAGRGERLVVGGYRLVELLATSDGGNSYKTLHPALANPVNLRFVEPAWLEPHDNVTDYLARTQAACLASNPHLANILDAGMHQGVPFVVQEYVDGCPMLRLVRELGTLPVPLACEYIRQTALALQEAHAKNITHGSISPRTILLTPVKRVKDDQGIESIRPRAGASVKLTDLGLTPRRLPLSQTLPPDSDPHGRIEFTPPEYVHQESPTLRGDIYSLGATFYFLLAGRPPVGGSNSVEVVQQLPTTTPTSIEYLRDDIPPAVGGLLSRMLTREPSMRPTLADILTTLQPHCEITPVPVAAPVDVPMASETSTIPNIPTALPVHALPNELAAPTIEPMPEGHPLPEIQPLDHDHEEAFGHSSLGADRPAAPRPRKPMTKSNRGWIIAGLCLHMLATLMCLSYLNVLPNPFAPSPPPEQKQDPEPKPKPKPKKNPNK